MNRQELVKNLVSDLSSLAYVNRMTGLWDHLRNKLCDQTSDENLSLTKIIETEKQSRFFVEQRARFRGRIDENLKILIHGTATRNDTFESE